MYSRQTLILDKLYDSSLKIKESAINTTKKSADKLENAARTAGTNLFDVYARIGESFEYNNNTQLAVCCTILAGELFAWTNIGDYLNLSREVAFEIGRGAMIVVASMGGSLFAYRIKKNRESERYQQLKEIRERTERNREFDF